MNKKIKFLVCSSTLVLLAVVMVHHGKLALADLTLGSSSVVSDGNLSLQGTNLLLTGNVGIGTATPAYPLDVVASTSTSSSVFAGNFTATATGSGAITGLNAAATVSAVGSSGGTFAGNFTATNNSGSSITSNGSVQALHAFAFNQGSTPYTIGLANFSYNFGASATTTDLIGIWNIVKNYSGTSTSMYGIKMEAWVNTGTVTNSYGIYMDTSIDRANSATNRYAIYSSSTSQTYLQGNLGIGSVTPTAKLDVNGHIASTQSAGAPSASVTGTGYSGASMGSNSTDTKGSITATVGAAVGTLVVTFQSSYSTAPHCVFSPATATAQVDNGKVYVTSSTSAMTLNFVATPTGGSETWNYWCAQ